MTPQASGDGVVLSADRMLNSLRGGLEVVKEEQLIKINYCKVRNVYVDLSEIALL